MRAVILQRLGFFGQPIFFIGGQMRREAVIDAAVVCIQLVAFAGQEAGAMMAERC